MKNKVRISKAQLVQMLKEWNHGAQPAAVQYVTTPRLTKEGKMKFGDVTRIANIGIMLGYNYTNSVNNQREREDEMRDFMSQPLWKGKGKRISAALSTHVEKGTFYMSYKAQQTFKSFHFDSALNFIPVSILKPYFPVSSNASQGTETAIYHREISIANIRRLKFKKTTYEIIPEKS
jgi:hypothetical protein